MRIKPHLNGALLYVCQISLTSRFQPKPLHFVSLHDTFRFCDYTSGNSLVTGVNVSTLTALTHLDLNACGLTALDVDSNVELEYFDCSSNKLTALNVNNNVALTMFDCSDNQLSTIRVVNNTALDMLDVSKNNLLNVNVRSNTVLKTLNVSDNAGITALALGYNTVLETLEASNTALTDIDLSKNLEMKNLNLAGCSGMHILDVTKNVALVNLNVGGTSLETLDVTNNVALTMLNYNGCKIDATGLKIGTFVVVAKVPGVVFYSSGSVVKIVSKDETKAEWGYYGTRTDAGRNTDGASNTDKIYVESPAAQWCRAKGASWYLPALDELKAVYNNKSKLNATLSSSSVGGTQFGTNYYWSSTEGNYWDAYSVNFSNGGTSGSSGKGSTYSVRAVRTL